MSENNYFTALANINVNDKTEKKNNLTYLSWAWAWGEIKKQHPDVGGRLHNTGHCRTSEYNKLEATK